MKTLTQHLAEVMGVLQVLCSVAECKCPDAAADIAQAKLLLARAIRRLNA